MQNRQENENRLSPTDFMRARRPELFSDTIIIEEPALDRNQIEFHLDTLTQRKEEIRFEHFSRRLAEKELCPNLLPQTGPTGGGDSKVDTETYPVSNSISDRWYEGNPERSSQERWAFAFSAKKRWRQKVKDDVKKIAETTRDYSLIYFITNQAVRDRDRALVEDELREKWNKDVRILDRSWIIEKVIQNNRWDVVYQTLDIDRPIVTSKLLIGPLDLERQRSLEELDRMIEDQDRYQNSKYQLAVDCLQSALLARGLGRPRAEIDGRLDRAERIARKGGNKRQLFRVLYQKAWTAYWWFNDFDELDRIHEVAVPLVIDSEWVWDLEKLVNLWQLGSTWRQAQKTLDNDTAWGDHTSQLRAKLSYHASNLAKPTSALWARTQIAMMDIALAAFKGTNFSPVLNEITDILGEAQTHPEYPFESVIQLAKDLNLIIGGDEAYDEFFERIIRLQSKRLGKAEEGKMRLDRGSQKLKSGKFYDAIDHYAKAQILLSQSDYWSEFIGAVAGTALGYEGAGLLWSARANLIAALDLVLYDKFKNGQLAYQALPLLRKLVWIEIQLGRVLCVLEWVQLLQFFSQALDLSEEYRKEIEEELRLIDAIFGILILRTRYENWVHLDRVPALMNCYSLFMSRLACMFLLGYESAIRFEIEQENEDLDHFFSMWLKQPAADDLPAQSEWHLNRTVVMRTFLLGCEIMLVVDNNVESIIIGEAVLAFLESFLSTTIKVMDYYATQSQLNIEVHKSESIDKHLLHKIEEDECGEVRIIITHSSVSYSEIVQNNEYQDELFSLLARVVSQLQSPLSFEAIKDVFAIDRAQDRAFFAAQSLLHLTNILSDNPKYHIKDWIDASFSESFTLLRTKPWVSDIGQNSNAYLVERPISFANGEPPKELFGVDSLKHRDLRILSPINLSLWDRAKWRGLAFAISPGNPPMPNLSLMFEDIETGLKIFRGWKKRLGNLDQDEWIGLTFITNIDRDNPYHYRVAIGINENYLKQEVTPQNRVTMVYRMQDMTPDNNRNLERFLELYNKSYRYRLYPGSLADPRLATHLSGDLYIEKQELRIIDAWRIGPQDLLCAAIGGIEKPFIPSGVDDPPFLRLTKRLT